MKDPTTEQLVMAAEFVGYSVLTYEDDNEVILHDADVVGVDEVWRPHESLDQMREIIDVLERDTTVAGGERFSAYGRTLRRLGEIDKHYGDAYDMAAAAISNAPADLRFAAFLEVV